MDVLTKTLWALFVAGQIFSAGNLNYQQEAGYYELNPIYGKHPDSDRVYITKVAETALIYGATKIFPKYESHILTGANIICWGLVYNNHQKGIGLKLRF